MIMAVHRKNAVRGKRIAYEILMRALMYISTGVTVALTLFLIIFVMAKGLPNVTWKLLSTLPSYLSGEIGILPDIMNTLYVVICSLLLVLPLGVGAAVYLTEYAENKKIVAAIEYAAETL